MFNREANVKSNMKSEVNTGVGLDEVVNADTDLKKRKYTYFITGGGTGGHIYPAVAVADALMKDIDTEEVYYVGNPNNLEYEIVKKKGYKFLGVNVCGMPRNFGFGFIKWAFQLLFAWIKCIFLILQYKPDVVFGTGGYVSAPTLLACISTKFLCFKTVPYMLHDCDAQPGLVSRKFSHNADCVSLAFDSAVAYINNKNCRINGNPIRENFQLLSKSEARHNLGLADKLTLCVMGGSQGAKSINNAVVEILRTLSLEYNMQIIFQTGKRNFEEVIKKLLLVYPDYLGDANLIVAPYFEDMVTVMKSGEIAVARSGSLSLSEISASGIAPILVPYPYAASDHQRKNAKFMVEKGAGLYIEDSEINPQSLLRLIVSLIDNPLKLARMKVNSQNLAKYDGTDKIVEQLKKIATKSSIK